MPDPVSMRPCHQSNADCLHVWSVPLPVAGYAFSSTVAFLLHKPFAFSFFVAPQDATVFCAIGNGFVQIRVLRQRREFYWQHEVAKPDTSRFWLVDDVCSIVCG